MDCPIDKWVITPLADQLVIAMNVCLLRIQKRGMTRNMRTVMVMTMLMVVVVINLVLPQQFIWGSAVVVPVCVPAWVLGWVATRLATWYVLTGCQLAAATLSNIAAVGDSTWAYSHWWRNPSFQGNLSWTWIMTLNVVAWIVAAFQACMFGGNMYIYTYMCGHVCVCGFHYTSVYRYILCLLVYTCTIINLNVYTTVAI